MRLYILFNQVLEMDALLRNHQADTTARRLQLERTLAQRQSELRTRTQEVEELTVKVSDLRKRVGEMEIEVNRVKSVKLKEDSEHKKQLQEKVWLPNALVSVFVRSTPGPPPLAHAQ